jgi:sarcosine oxidase
MKKYDVIVAGLGAMGSAALYHLASRGIKAAGFDRYVPPHTLGSSHGETRMIREAYYEHPAYVPLVRRAYDLWHDLASKTGQTTIVETGGAYAGPADGELVSGMLRSAGEHAIAIERLNHREAERRFPWLRFDNKWDIITEPRAGFVYPERCIDLQLQLAGKAGAEIHGNEPLTSWNATTDGVIARTTHGEYAAQRLILCTGAWIVDALAGIGVHAVVERQPLFWFEARDPTRAPSTVWALEFEHGKLLYGFPATENGVKVAIHYGGVQRTTAEQIDRAVHDEDSQHLRHFTDQYTPGVLGAIKQSAICMYTNTPDLHFIFDAHPEHENVLVVSACSGHGFKFSSAIGEAAAQWARDGVPAHDLSLFALSRFA